MDRPRLLTPARPTGSRRRLLGLGAAASSALVVPGCSRGRGPTSRRRAARPPRDRQRGRRLRPVRRRAERHGQRGHRHGSSTPVETNGSIAEHPAWWPKGTADMGFSTSDSALAAYEGHGDLDPAAESSRRWPDVRQLRARGGADGLAVRSSKRRDDKVVSYGPKNSGTRWSRSLIPIRKPTFKLCRSTLGLAQSIDELRTRPTRTPPSRRIDAMIWSGVRLPDRSRGCSTMSGSGWSTSARSPRRSR